MEIDQVLARLRAALAGRYEVERELAAGGTATVYLAHDVRHGRRVAIKVLHPELSAMLGAERFLAEIRTTATLQHPHILPLFDSGSADGLLFYVMPLVEDGTLRTRLTRERQLPMDDAVRIANEVADALDYAHRRGVVHRDIKPENILLHEGRALVADFGIALAVQSSDTQRMTRPGFLLGTPAYMSPEQASGDANVDGRSDQYSLACVLFECCAGEPPFSGATLQALLAKRFAGPVPDVGVLRAGVEASVRAALTRAMSAAPTDRFPSTAAFGAAIASSHSTSAPEAARASTYSRGRNRVVVALGLGVAILALALVAFFVAGPFGRRPIAPPAAAASVPADRAPVASRQLTFTGTAEQPSFSPDGRQVAYVDTQCEHADGVGCTPVLRLHDFGSAQTVVLATAEKILNPFWSADGAWVVVLMTPAGGEFGTYLVSRLGGAARRLGPRALVAFSATGDTVLLAAIPQGAARFLRRVRAATSETLDSVPLPPGLTDLQGLLPSPDGHWIALRLENRLLLATPDRRVTDSLAFRNAGSLRWDPRGDALYAVVPGVGTNVELQRVRVDARRGRFAGRMESLLNLGRAAGATFDVAPDGKRLVYTGGTVTTTLWALEPSARTAHRQLAASTGWLGNPYLSSDGQLVGYEMTDQAGDNVYVQPFAGGSQQAATHEATGWEALGWVPRTHRLTFASPARPAPLYAQELPGGTRRIIGRAGALPLADGGTVELEAAERRLVFRTATGAEHAVALPDSLGAFLSLWAADADGGGAYVLTVGASRQRRVVRVNPTTGALTFVLELLASQSPYALSADRGRVVYATWTPGRNEGRPTIWQVRAGAPATQVTVLPFACDEESLTMSADGRRFACARRVGRPDLFVLERFDRFRE